MQRLSPFTVSRRRDVSIDRMSKLTTQFEWVGESADDISDTRFPISTVGGIRKFIGHFYEIIYGDCQTTSLSTEWERVRAAQINITGGLSFGRMVIINESICRDGFAGTI